MNRFFQQAARMVDEAIARDGKPVDVVERNKRVQAVEYMLSTGRRPNAVNCRAQLSTIQFAIPTKENEHQCTTNMTPCKP